MNNVRVHISASLDGYVAGPNQSMENPLGEGGERLHDWVVALKAWREASGLEGGEENASTPVVLEEYAIGDDGIVEQQVGEPARMGTVFV